MKKYFMFALATVAMLSVSSCLSEKEMDLTPQQGKSENEGIGYISINATTDDAVITRADITGASLNTWYARVYTGTTFKWGEAGFTLINNTALAAVGLDASKTWTVSVRNFDSESTANSSNSPYGAPYYEGINEAVTISAGTVPTPVTVACGAPKNSKLTVVKDGFTGTNLVINITSPRTVTFTDNSGFNNSGVAYFPAGDVQFYITYTFGGVSKRWPAEDASPNYSTLALTAGKAKSLTITSNSNGTITLTISTTDYADDTPTSITFDAVTGALAA